MEAFREEIEDGASPELMDMGDFLTQLELLTDEEWWKFIQTWFDAEEARYLLQTAIEDQILNFWEAEDYKTAKHKLEAFIADRTKAILEEAKS